MTESFVSAAGEYSMNETARCCNIMVLIPFGVGVAGFINDQVVDAIPVTKSHETMFSS